MTRQCGADRGNGSPLSQGDGKLPRNLREVVWCPVIGQGKYTVCSLNGFRPLVSDHITLSTKESMLNPTRTRPPGCILFWHGETQNKESGPDS